MCCKTLRLVQGEKKWTTLQMEILSTVRLALGSEDGPSGRRVLASLLATPVMVVCTLRMVA